MTSRNIFIFRRPSRPGAPFLGRTLETLRLVREDGNEVKMGKWNDTRPLQ